MPVIPAKRTAKRMPAKVVSKRRPPVSLAGFLPKTDPFVSKLAYVFVHPNISNGEISHRLKSIGLKISDAQVAKLRLLKKVPPFAGHGAHTANGSEAKKAWQSVLSQLDKPTAQRFFELLKKFRESDSVGLLDGWGLSRAKFAGDFISTLKSAHDID